MFWIRYKDRDGQGRLIDVEVPLFPAPTEVDYPEKRLYTTHTTQDGAVVVQRPLRDHRVRKWIWRGFSPQLLTYENQWKLLESLEYRNRLANNLPGYVEIWEDVTGVGGFGKMTDTGERIYTKVKFLQVDRTPRKGGGFVKYDTSTVEFVIEDESYKHF